MKVVKKALIAAASVVGLIAVVGVAPAAATPFTWDPSAVGLVGGTINADNYNVADFARIQVLNNAGDFSEQGVLNVLGFLNGLTPASAPGLGSTYSLFVTFSGTGNQGGPIPTTNGQTVTGYYNTLTYTLWAAPVNHPTITVNASGATATAAGAFALGTGSLVGSGPTSGNTVTLQKNATGLSPKADIEVTLDPCTGAAAPCTGDESGFFFFPSALADIIQFGDFSATGTVTTVSGNDVFIKGGGGNVTLAAVPEPLTLSLFGAGLVGVAGLRRRRSKKA